jgi:hypothetical protein
MAERDDIERRLPVWCALSDLFLDTEQTDEEYGWIARKLNESGYNRAELRRILDEEVAPAFAFNLFDILGHWGGWTEEQVLDLVTRTQAEWAAFSLAKRTLVRSHLDEEWAKLEPLLTAEGE